MPLLHLAILAVVQGLTELLPISSSAHLILTWEVFSRLDQPINLGPARELVLDIASHVGTLVAICLYFRRDVAAMAVGAAKLVVGRRDPGTRLLFCVAVATIPAAAVGYFLKDTIANELRLVLLIGWTQVGFGLLLFFADRVGLTMRRVEHLRFTDGLVVGCAQALALVPGTSRSGITMTAGRLLGLERSEAARFSFLVAIPVTFGAGLLGGWELWQFGSAELGIDAAIAAALSFFASLGALAFLMAWVRRASFTPFVVYRVLLGGVLLWLVYSGTINGLRF